MYLYPIPSADNTYWVMGAEGARVELVVYTLDGRIVCSEEVETSAPIRCPLNKGLYMYTLSSEGKILKTGKLIQTK